MREKIEERVRKLEVFTLLLSGAAVILIFILSRLGYIKFLPSLNDFPPIVVFAVLAMALCFTYAIWFKYMSEIWVTSLVNVLCKIETQINKLSDKGEYK